MKKLIRFFFHLSIYAVVVGIVLTSLLRVGMLLFSRSKTHLPDEVTAAPVALVLGAGLNRDGTPGLVLRDRVKTASQLYFDGTVDKILMSGDNTSQNYDEPSAMGDYAVSLGVPREDIVLDFAGRRTYDSCFRAKAIFGVKQVIVITQAFHLPRALFLCNAFEIEVQGVPADDGYYRRSNYIFWWVREILASLNAYWDVLIAHPQPILGEPEPIFP